MLFHSAPAHDRSQYFWSLCLRFLSNGTDMIQTKMSVAAMMIDVFIYIIPTLEMRLSANDFDRIDGRCRDSLKRLVRF